MALLITMRRAGVSRCFVLGRSGTHAAVELRRELVVAEHREVKAGVVIHPTRMALTASKAGPPLFDVVAAMGREASVSFLRQFAGFLRRME